MENKKEETLAEKYEEINRKIEEIINEQIEIKKLIKQDKVALMKRINKIQEYNEIDDMRQQLLDRKIDGLLNLIKDMNDNLYI